MRWLRLVKQFFYFIITFLVFYIILNTYQHFLNNKIVTNNGYKGNSSIQYVLNLHVWPLSCEFTLNNLREHPLFPVDPHQQRLVNTLDISWGEENIHARYFGYRLFGFLQVPVTGHFVFSLSSDSNAELWLSKEEQKGQLLCQVVSEFNKRSIDNAVNSQKMRSISNEVFLEQNIFYFIEIFQIQPSGVHRVLVKWRPPDSEKFQKINEEFLFSHSGQYSELNKLIQLTSVAKHSRKEQSILENTKFLKNSSKYLDFHEVNLALKTCLYKPGYTGKDVTSAYQVVEKFFNPTFVYPEIRHDKLKDGKWIPWFPLDKNSAEIITEKYMKHLESAYPGRYQLTKILNVEKKSNWLNKLPKYFNGTMKDGDRYLLELQLWDSNNKEDVLLSQYVYDHYKKDLLCYPEGVQWNKSTPIYFLVSVKKQGAWVHHLIKNLEKIHHETKDGNVHLVLYDYNTTEINIEEELVKSSFKKYHILKAFHSKYSRTYSLNRAAEGVSDPHAIIFTIDLHLEIPSTFPNSVRKHCIEGKMVYTPIITRLSCGATPSDPSGTWDPWGYGMFGAYKSDWDHFQGFDEVRFSTTWGGEDWDLVNRAYKVGLEFERIKHADFYHYYHTRKGMW